MAHPYKGIDAPVVIPPNPSPRGKWLNGVAIDDGDNRDAASAMALVECAMDRTVWLWWRTFDLISGGTYAWTATVTEANHWIHNGVNQFRSAGNLLASTAAGGAKLYVGDASLGDGHVIVTADGDIQWTGAGSAATWVSGATLTMLLSAGNATFYNHVDIPGTLNASGITVIDGLCTISADTLLHGNFTRDGPLTLSGDNAYTSPRYANAGDADHAGFEPWKWDVVFISGASTHRSWTFATPPTGAHPTCKFVKFGHFHGTGHTVDLNGLGTFDFTASDGGNDGLIEVMYMDSTAGWVIIDASEWDTAVATTIG